jgi:TolB protein
MGDKNVNISDSEWSPDGKYIAASMIWYCPPSQKDCTYTIFTMKADGSDQTQIMGSLGSNWGTTWSPDGKQIAFASDRDGDYEIYVCNRDGSDVHQLTKNSDFDGWPRWSPDGKLIAFETSRNGGDWDLYVMNPDGSDPRAITQNSTDDYDESWSPDGKWLVYVSNASGSGQIQIVGIDGKNEMKVTDDKSNNDYPSWIQ